eukprot:6144384-Prymnesium_polylepis.1
MQEMNRLKSELYSSDGGLGGIAAELEKLKEQTGSLGDAGGLEKMLASAGGGGGGRERPKPAAGGGGCTSGRPAGAAARGAGGAA